MRVVVTQYNWKNNNTGVVKHNNDIDRGSINPLDTKLFRRNMNMYLQFISFLHIDMAQVVELLLE